MGYFGAIIRIAIIYRKIRFYFSYGSDLLFLKAAIPNFDIQIIHLIYCVKAKSSCSRLVTAYRFPSDIISNAVWVYYRFNLSHLDVEDLFAERGITVSYEAIRLWCIKFGAKYARRLRRKHRGFGDTFFIDEVFVKINGKQHYLWRAVDQDSEVVDVFLQAKRDGAAAKRFFKRLLRNHGDDPRKIVTDKLRSYGVAHRALIPE